ncbi:MAG: MFS transporter [Hyphomicrobiaceae bacterium]|nr:MFS transporter [Hyphomicrobiaceae bacterium]
MTDMLAAHWQPHARTTNRHQGPMIYTHVRTFGALLASLSFLLVGMGLQNTLLGVRAGIEGFSTIETGLVMSGYFVGYLAGCWIAPRTIIRVGHIRTFSMLASLASGTAILHAVEPAPWTWLALRIITGASIAGLHLVVESWLNSATTRDQRGGLLALYLVVNLGSIAAGQQLLNAAEPAGFTLFALSSVLLSLAVVPVALTRTQAPAPPTTPKLDLGRLYAVSPVALVGTAVSGLTNGAFWGMAPTYGQTIGLDAFRIANFMTIVVIGGMVLQWPLGRLSDHMDRRIVLVAIAAALSALSAFLALVDPIAQRPLFLALSFLYGGCLLTLYSICNAHANDASDAAASLEVASGLLLVFGAGAMAGPLVASVAMSALGVEALFELTAITAVSLALFGVWRLMVKAAPSAEQTSEFEPVPAGLASPIPQDVDTLATGAMAASDNEETGPEQAI